MFYAYPERIFEGAHQDPSAAEPQPKEHKRTERRGTEVAEFGALLHKILFSAYSASPR